MNIVEEEYWRKCTSSGGRKRYLVALQCCNCMASSRLEIGVDCTSCCFPFTSAYHATLLIGSSIGVNRGCCRGDTMFPTRNGEQLFLKRKKITPDF